MIATWLVLGACSSTNVVLPTGDGDGTPHDTDTTGGTTETASDSGHVPVGDPVTESFPYAVAPADVLFIIDASTSMIGYTESLLGTLEGLVDTWMARNIDFHAGVVDIDESDIQGQLLSIGGRRWSDPLAPTPGSLLRELVDDVPDPSTQEEGRTSTYLALTAMGPGLANDGFLRPGSDLAIILHSDEVDQSDDNPVSTQQFIDYLLALRPDPNLRGFNTIVATEDFHDISVAVGGVVWSVSNEPYGPALDAVTATIQGNNAFVLTEAPWAPSITAHVVEPDGTEVDLPNDSLDYDSKTNTVDLDEYYPDSGATVEITYNPLL